MESACLLKAITQSQPNIGMHKCRPNVPDLIFFLFKKAIYVDCYVKFPVFKCV